MKKFYKTIAMLCITCALGFCACSMDTVKEEPIQQEDAVEEVSETIPGKEIEKYLDVETVHTVKDYVSDDNETLGFYVYVPVKNKSDKVVSGANFTVIINDKSDAVAYSEDAALCTLAPGEKGLCACYIEMPRDFILNDMGSTDMQCSEFQVFDESHLTAYKQTDLTFDGFHTESDGEMNTKVNINITNNSNKTNDTSYVRILCKKDGEVVGYAESLPVTIAANDITTVSINASHEIPTGCDDFDVFVDYIN